MATGEDRRKTRRRAKSDNTVCVDLLRKVIKDDPDAYWGLLERTHRYVWYQLRLCGSDIPEADLPDLVDEVYYRFFRYMIPRPFLLIHDGQIFKCLRTITKRVVSDYIKKRNRRSNAITGFLASQQPGDPLSEVESSLDQEKHAADKLQCKMITLRAGGKTYQEIADAVGLKLHQVTAFFYKLRKSMKKS